MTLKEVLDIVKASYPDNDLLPADGYDEDGRFVETTGDALFDFLIMEIGDTYNEGAPDREQLTDAREAIRGAETDLHAVYQGLGRRWQEL